METDNMFIPKTFGGLVEVDDNSNNCRNNKKASFLGAFFTNLFFELLFKLIGINAWQKEFFLIFEMNFITK